MELSPYVEELRSSLILAAESGGEESRAVAERLLAALDSAARLVMLEALSAAAAEITRDLAPTSVDVRLRGLDPEFVVTAADADFGGHAPSLPAPEADESTTTRTTLRLPEQLKLKVENAAAREGLSVNAWLVRAVAQAVESHRTPGRSAPASGQRFTGWAH